MAKKLKDLGGKKYEEFSSISAAQKAGSIYYGKKLKSGEIKKKAAVLSTDLSKGQSLRSFMNEKLKGSESTGANYKVKSAKKIRPKLRPKSVETNKLTEEQKVNANPKDNTYRGGQRKAKVKLPNTSDMGDRQRSKTQVPGLLSKTGRKTLKKVKEFNSSSASDRKQTLENNFTSQYSKATEVQREKYNALTAKQRVKVRSLIRNEGRTFRGAVNSVTAQKPQ